MRLSVMDPLRSLSLGVVSRCPVPPLEHDRARDEAWLHGGPKGERHAASLVLILLFKCSTRGRIHNNMQRRALQLTLTY